MECIRQHKKSIMVLVGSGFLFGAGYLSGGVMFASTLYNDMVRNEIHKEMNQSRVKQASKRSSVEGLGEYPNGKDHDSSPTHISLPPISGGSGEKFPNLFVEIMMGIKDKIDDISIKLIKETKNDN